MFWHVGMSTWIVVTLCVQFNIYRAIWCKGRDSDMCPQGRGCSHKPTHGGMSSASEHNSVLAALLVHAAADGLAVGAASMSTSIRLAVTVGFAMVLHKGPVALGLSAYLVGQHASATAVLRVCHLPNYLMQVCFVQWWDFVSTISIDVAAGFIHICFDFTGSCTLQLWPATAGKWVIFQHICGCVCPVLRRHIRVCSFCAHAARPERESPHVEQRCCPVPGSPDPVHYQPAGLASSLRSKDLTFFCSSQ